MYVMYKISDSRDRQNTGEIRLMTKKNGNQKFSALKWKCFPKKGHFRKFGPRKCFPSPQLGGKSPSTVVVGLRESESIDEVVRESEKVGSRCLRWYPRPTHKNISRSRPITQLL